MTKKLKIWGISNQDTGVQFYRINQPLRFIGHEKLAEVHTLPFFGQHAQHLTSQEFKEYYELEGEWADVLFTTVASNREYLALIFALRDLYKLKLVVDLDDDILSTHLEPNSPAYKAYMNETARFAEYAQACLREADLVTVSTEYMKRKYESINSNIVVIKNAIDPGFFRYKNKTKPKKVNLGFAGSGSHQADLMMVEPIIETLKKNQNIGFNLLGPLKTDLADKQVNWVDMLKYPKALAELGFDIGLAPLKDSMMSRAKSNLRWLEYSILRIPTVASDVVPFRGVENITLVKEPEEWQTALERLIKDKKHRTETGQNAYNEVRANYDPRYWSRQLFNAIERLF